MTTKRKDNSENMSIQKAVDLGEYDPEVLSLCKEWSGLSYHAQLQYIKEGLDNRRKQLLMQWAEMDRAIDLRLKPNLEIAKHNVEKQLKKIEDDREKLYFEYSKKY
ncbi:hypothetical protein IPM62_05085 [Candidatus Woesebacteria bacterium]|nr:MAG: hypothetical protein IPM62_05085 [Candidatus Woesebacteria bacterium]